MPDTTAAPDSGIITGAPPQELLDEIVRRIVSGVPGVRRIILFGSAASGQMHEDSDIDLLVVLDEWERTPERWLTIRRLLPEGWPYDLVVRSWDHFERRKCQLGAIEEEAVHAGRELYSGP